MDNDRSDRLACLTRKQVAVGSVFEPGDSELQHAVGGLFKAGYGRHCPG